MSGLDFYRQLFDAGALVFDVGANLGYFTSKFLECGAGKVVAIEPQTDMCKNIRERFSKKNVSVLGLGLGSSDKSEKMYICKKSKTISTFSKKWTTGRFSTDDFEFVESKNLYPITTLDFIIDTFGIPEYVKIDVEGYEFEVLSGLSHPIKSISFEFVEEFKSDISLCAHLIEKLGKYEFNFTRGDNDDFETEWCTFARIYEQMNAEMFQASLLNHNAWGNVFARIKKIRG